MPGVKLGVQLCQQHCTLDQLRRAWCGADELGLDSVFLWDHFAPLSGDPQGGSFEPWTLLSAMAVETERIALGTLVSAIPFRPPDLLADMARNVSLLSDGRLVLGVGAGWYERDFVECELEHGTTSSRLRRLEDGVRRIARRLDRIAPPPPAPIRLLIGGGGTGTTLRIVAQHADIWNCIEPPDRFADKNRALDAWCQRVGRDPRTVERTVAIGIDQLAFYDDYVTAGATHVIVGLEAPFDLTPVVELRNRR
jgi:probable F420-dependent oxidoreductase